MAMLVSFLASGARVAYKVNYEGKVIATVSDKSEFDKALKLVKAQVSGDNIEAAVSKPKYVTSLVLASSIDDKEELSKAIIDNTEGIVKASLVEVDGKQVAIVCGNEIEDYLNKLLCSYDVEGAKCQSSFVEDVKITEGLYLASDLENVEFVKAELANLSVKTTATLVTDSEIEFKTVTKNSSSHVKGYVAVTVKGVNGKRQLTETVELVNGEELSRETVSDVVVSEPVDKVVVKGTAPTKVSAEQQQIANNSGFIFPLPKGSYKVSAYYGDGRGHKGVDLAAPKGTPIMAVASGTVVYSGWRGGYGYFVEIDHGNNLKTRYGHASALCVEKGETVKAGDVIALVGTTGDSTGNHLHIEVLYKGVQYNPAPYIGLK